MTKEFFERGKQIAKWADKQGETDMPCNNNCNQGRNCNCDRKMDKAIFEIAPILVIIILISCICMGSFMIYRLMHGNKGQDCAVEVQFAGGVKATYLGTSI